jgi:hypothetical protein
MAQAAREVGSLFLADGDIVRAYPYFRAGGDREPIIAAIEQLKADQAAEGIIEIALGERVNPLKGLDRLIAREGNSLAITYYQQFPDLEPPRIPGIAGPEPPPGTGHEPSGSDRPP